MGVAAILLLVANVVYATSYVVTRVALQDVPPTTLALLRLVLGAAVLVPLGRRGTATAPPPGQRARVFWMGALGFAAAFALSHWGLVVSSATNAALLIVVEPLTLVVLAPLAALEWAAGARPMLTPSAILATLYLALVITAGAYLVWNWALARVEAARAAPFLTVQPVVGAALGAFVLGDPVTPFTAIGGALVVVGLWMTVTGRR